ncbi:MAG: phosphatidylserine decarboxylase family protein [Bacteroidales bacterium]|nr:phosphatidylserine decarboxylase family protein [Bacteroidales bacterium]
MTIHREGFKIIRNAFLIILAVSLLEYFFIPEWGFFKPILYVIDLALFFLVVRFFRYPNRKYNLNDDVVLCPADGEVCAIEEVYEPEYYKEKRRQVSIFMSVHNVHANVVPMSGEVKYMRHHHGKFLVAWHPKSSTENERTTIVYENPKISILVRQIAGLVARRIVCYSKEGTTVKQGDELGFIKFGSRLDIYLPLDAEVKVQLKDIVKGGMTTLAEIAK